MVKVFKNHKTLSLFSFQGVKIPAKLLKLRCFYLSKGLFTFNFWFFKRIYNLLKYND